MSVGSFIITNLNGLSASIARDKAMTDPGHLDTLETIAFIVTEKAKKPNVHGARKPAAD